MSSYAACASNSRLQHLRSPLHRPFACSDGHQHTGKITHHVMKECVRAYVDHDEPSELEQLEMMNGLDRRLGLTLSRTKRTEIVRANQRCRGGTHPLDIQRAMVPGDLFRHMRRPNLIVIDHIAVTTSHCTETRIKMRGHLLGPGHADIGRQVHVRPHYPGVHAPFYRGVEMHHLAAGMHQRIGSAGATERKGMPAGDSG